MSNTNNFNTVKKVWSVLQPVQRRSAILLLGLMGIGMALETLGIGLVIPAIALFTQDDIAGSYPVLRPILNFFGNPDHKALVTGGMLLLLGVYLIKNLFLAFLTWRQTRFTYLVGAQLSQDLFAVYLRQPYTFHLQRNSAILLRNVYNEVSVFMGAITAFMTMITESLVVFAICVMLIVIEPTSALMVIVVVGFAAGGFYHFTRGQIKRWGLARQYHEGLRIQHLQQGLGGVKDVILLGRETDFLEQYRIHNTKSARIVQMMITLKQMPRLWLELLAVGGLVAMVLVMLGQGREMGAILPVLGFFAVAVFRLMPSANRILGAVQGVRYDLPVINTLSEELNLGVPGREKNNQIGGAFRSVLELRSVTYKYETAVGPSIHDLSLTIGHGESVGFIGASGAGKSTLVDIVLGLLQPSSGTVYVDGKDIQESLRNWQDQIGYVPQTIYLTDDTLRRNVAFGLADEVIDERAIWKAIRAAQLEELVSELPEGLDTQVGERGIRLSGGQRQRIGIARALYHDPAVLVLDEATSSLDEKTEHGVMQAVQALHGAKTIIIVTHRLSTVEHVDRLYRMEKGRIVEEGRVADVLGYSAAEKSVL